jgi:hypothetical protein
MTLDNVLTGVVTGVVASIIIIIMQLIYDYMKRKKYEMFHFYEFDSYDVDECAPPEYLRESGNAGHTKVKMELPFDMRSVQIFLKNELIYEESNVPANSSIWVCCDCSFENLYESDEEVGYTLKCITTQHEKRVYEYKKVYTMLGKPICYALKLKKQNFTLATTLH